MRSTIWIGRLPTVLTMATFLLSLFYLPKIIKQIDRVTIDAYNLQPLPKIHISNLSTKAFEETFLNKQPLILVGSTICPTDMDFMTIHEHCHGQIPSNYVHRKRNDTESVWAGLQAGDKTQMIDFTEWADHMSAYDNEKKNESPEFLFDVPMVEICPSFYGKISIPAHFIGKFASQFKHRKTNKRKSKSSRMKQSDGLRKTKESENSKDQNNNIDSQKILNELCTNLPFFNIYMAEKSFQTDLHIDAGHTSFMASMCVGRKQWRVMTNQDYAKSYNGIGLEGVPLGDKHIMGTIRSPFNTWINNENDENKNDLQDINGTIYEGILNPGELLYIPAGFPHAATTLDNSIMIASNDHSLDNLQEGIAFCDHVDNDHVACPGLRQKFKAFTDHKDDDDVVQATMKHQPMSLPQSTGCEKTYQLLLDVNKQNSFVEILPTNFHLYIQKRPLIIMKSQKNCGYCLYLLKHWDRIISDYSPPVQFGVLNCFQGQCQYGDNHLYKQLMQRLEGTTSPQLLFVSLDQSRKTLEFVDYYGQYTFDDIRVWASYNTGSAISLDPIWYKFLWTTFHATTYHTMIITDKIGTSGFGMLIFLLILLPFLVCAQWSHRIAPSNRHRKKKKL